MTSIVAMEMVITRSTVKRRTARTKLAAARTRSRVVFRVEQALAFRERRFFRFVMALR